MGLFKKKKRQAPIIGYIENLTDLVKQHELS